LTEAELRAIRNALGSPAEVIAECAAVSKPFLEKNLLDAVVELVARHPVTLEEISTRVNGESRNIEAALQALIENGAIEMRRHQGKNFFVAS